GPLSGALRGASGPLSGALRGASGPLSGALRGASGPLSGALRGASGPLSGALRGASGPGGPPGVPSGPSAGLSAGACSRSLAPPLDDVLPGSADRRDVVARRGQELDETALGDVGVLVLVQQDRRVARPELGGHRRVLHDLDRPRHLVAEVDAAGTELGVGIGADDPGQLDPFAGARHDVIGELGGVAQDPFVLLDDPLRGDEVV